MAHPFLEKTLIATASINWHALVFFFFSFCKTLQNPAPVQALFRISVATTIGDGHAPHYSRLTDGCTVRR